jgi:hypothetical protein
MARSSSTCTFAPRFDYGEATPWLYDAPDDTHYALAGDDALIVACEDRLSRHDDYELSGRLTVGAGQRVRLEVRGIAPEALDDEQSPRPSSPADLDRRVDAAVAHWRDWSRQARDDQAERAAHLQRERLRAPRPRGEALTGVATLLRVGNQPQSSMA